jgi:transposase InsO family protein
MLTYKEQRDVYLTNLIKQIHDSAKGRYGSPRILDSLKDLGERVSRKRVNRLMKENNIYAKARRKYKITTNSKHNNLIAPNLLNQDFTASLPNQVWVSDITYIWTQEGWLYLAVTLDLYSRMVVGWSVSDRIKKELVIDAFLKAYWARKPKPWLIHHSDRGSQYASKDFQKILGNVGSRPSMSGGGN